MRVPEAPWQIAAESRDRASKGLRETVAAARCNLLPLPSVGCRGLRIQCEGGAASRPKNSRLSAAILVRGSKQFARSTGRAASVVSPSRAILTLGFAQGGGTFRGKGFGLICVHFRATAHMEVAVRILKLVRIPGLVLVILVGVSGITWADDGPFDLEATVGYPLVEELVFHLVTINGDVSRFLWTFERRSLPLSVSCTLHLHAA